MYALKEFGFDRGLSETGGGGLMGAWGTESVEDLGAFWEDGVGGEWGSGLMEDDSVGVGEVLAGNGPTVGALEKVKYEHILKTETGTNGVWEVELRAKGEAPDEAAIQGSEEVSEGGSGVGSGTSRESVPGKDKKLKVSKRIGKRANSKGVSHTKMCRDRLNGMFERLKCTLPPPPSGVEVKHKAQILDFAISVLKEMISKTKDLESELAVSSSRATNKWIADVVRRAPDLPAAVSEVMQLLCCKGRWKYSELWVAKRTEQRHGVITGCELELEKFIVNKNSGNGNASDAAIEEFANESHRYTFSPQVGVPGRVWSSMRPEWLGSLNDTMTFLRAPLALKCGIRVCLAVPVTVSGKVEGVMALYDTRHRDYDPKCCDLAAKLISSLGNAYGAARIYQKKGRETCASS